VRKASTLVDEPEKKAYTSVTLFINSSASSDIRMSRWKRIVKRFDRRRRPVITVTIHDIPFLILGRRFVDAHEFLDVQRSRQKGCRWKNNKRLDATIIRIVTSEKPDRDALHKQFVASFIPICMIILWSEIVDNSRSPRPNHTIYST
jgi:hypothetical protein